jgi:1-deoxy-D-xylulose 5-phosphate reductoisomerase
MFPTTKILKYLPKNNTLYETALVTINDFFVDKFLNNKISFTKLIDLILNYAQYYKFTKFKKSPVLSIDDIISTRNYVILKLDSIGI